jgi:hypothetical protein
MKSRQQFTQFADNSENLPKVHKKRTCFLKNLNPTHVEQKSPKNT